MEGRPAVMIETKSDILNGCASLLMRWLLPDHGVDVRKHRLVTCGTLTTSMCDTATPHACPLARKQPLYDDREKRAER